MIIIIIFSFSSFKEVLPTSARREATYLLVFKKWTNCRRTMIWITNRWHYLIAWSVISYYLPYFQRDCHWAKDQILLKSTKSTKIITGGPTFSPKPIWTNCESLMTPSVIIISQKPSLISKSNPPSRIAWLLRNLWLCRTDFCAGPGSWTRRPFH